MFTNIIKLAARAHAIKEYPREACGLVVMVGRKASYFPCNNIATKTDSSPTGAHEEFIIDPRSRADAEDLGRIIGVVHSHPDSSATASDADRAECARSGVPWLIFSWPQGEYVEIMPERLSLRGRPFILGSSDCWTLIKDYHAANGVIMRNHEVDYQWWNAEDPNYKRDDFYDSLPPAEGFIEVSEITAGCMITMYIGDTQVANHAGVILPNGEILHHLYNQLSCSTIFGRFYRDRMAKIWRHKDLPNPEDLKPC